MLRPLPNDGAQRLPKAGFILRTQIYAVYADHFAHVGLVFSATNADLRCSYCSDAEYRHPYNTPTFTLTFAPLFEAADLETWMLDCHWLLARHLCVCAGFYAGYLKQNLINRDIHITIIRRLVRLYGSQLYRVRWGDFLSDGFTSSNGVAQGGNLSPRFFSCIY